MTMDVATSGFTFPPDATGDSAPSPGAKLEAALPRGYGQPATGRSPVGRSPVGQSGATTGEPQASGRSAASPPVRPAPLPKRPKGRWFVGGCLLLICGVVSYTIWDSLLHYPVHGVVAGRVIHISPKHAGTIATMHVREGQWVVKGQLLMTLDDGQHRLEMGRLNDQLRQAQADLAAQVSQLNWQSQLRGDRNQKALGEYYELWGELAGERFALSAAEADLERLLSIRALDPRAVSDQELDSARYLKDGRAARVQKLTIATEELKKRVEVYDQFRDDATQQLRPFVIKLENVQADLDRWQRQFDGGQVCSPVNGVVVKVLRFTGEYSGVADHLLEIVEDGSLEAVMYVPQQQYRVLPMGREVRVWIPSHDRRLTCSVVRRGDQLEAAPANIARYYRRDARLLPVYLRPKQGVSGPQLLCLGAEVKLPYGWWAVRPTDSVADPRQQGAG